MIAETAEVFKKAGFNELDGVLEKLMKEKEAFTFLGSLPTTQGLLVVLFSHRHNEDVGLLVTGTDHPRVLARVHEFLATAGRRPS